MMYAKYKGFTLVELITVIIILGVVSVGISGFIRSGAQIYVDTTERERLLSASRFVVERINREVRAALPNSLRLTSAGSTRHCLEFVPVRWSSFYIDIPTGPDSAANSFQAVRLNAQNNEGYTFSNGDSVVVYPLNNAHVYTQPPLESSGTYRGRRFPLASVSAAVSNLVTLTIAGNGGSVPTGNALFDQDSTASRLYVVGTPISYCAHSDGRLTRHTGYGFSTSQSANLGSIGNGVLMGDGLVNTLSGSPGNIAGDPFRLTAATLRRNAVLHTRFIFGRNNDERIEFNNEIQVANVP